MRSFWTRDAFLDGPPPSLSQHQNFKQFRVLKSIHQILGKGYREFILRLLTRVSTADNLKLIKTGLSEIECFGPTSKETIEDARGAPPID